MTRGELFEVIRNGENSGVEFKRDQVENHEVAKELVGFLNLAGGLVLLGVADDGSIVGTTRDDIEEWVAELCREKIDPPIIPYISKYPEVEPGRQIVAVQVPAGPDKPYARLHNKRRTYFVRVGSTTREASRDELERMFQASGKVQYGRKPVPGATLQDLDFRRLRDYFGHILSSPFPTEENLEAWERLLINLEFAVSSEGVLSPTIDGMLLFGQNPRRFVPQSGIRAVAFPGTEMNYADRGDEILRGPLVPLRAADGSLVESGLVEQALDFIRKTTEARASLENGRLVASSVYPADVLREVIVNALVHRDYSIYGTDILLTIFSDRIEAKSPGRLPNSATVDALKTGFRWARNQTLVNVMRDYRYVEFRGMGIREKVIPGMKNFNGTEPDFIETERDFTVRLWKEAAQARSQQDSAGAS